MHPVTWTVEDSSTSNPLGKSGEFEFEVDFIFEPEEQQVRYDSDLGGYPGSPARAIVSAVCCTHVSLTGEEPREPEKVENKKLQQWFFDWLEQHPKEENALCSRALKLNDPSNDVTDWEIEAEERDRLDDYF